MLSEFRDYFQREEEIETVKYVVISGPYSLLSKIWRLFVVNIDDGMAVIRTRPQISYLQQSFEKNETIKLMCFSVNDKRTKVLYFETVMSGSVPMFGVTFTFVRALEKT